MQLHKYLYVLQYHEDKTRIKDALKIGKVICDTLFFLVRLISDFRLVTIY